MCNKLKCMVDIENAGNMATLVLLSVELEVGKFNFPLQKSFLFNAHEHQIQAWTFLM